MSLSGRLRVARSVAACILAALPSTTLIPLPLTLALTRRYRREDLLKRLHLMIPWARFCCRRVLRVRLDVQGKHHLPHPSRGYLYVGNHQSYADTLVLMNALDTVAFLGKDLIRRMPVVGRCAYAGGSVFVSRGDKESRGRALRRTIRMSTVSTAVMIFPEGTRSQDGELRDKIYPAGIRAAFEHGLKVLPVGLDGSWRIIPKTMDDVRPGQQVAVTIGAPLDPGDYAEADAFVEAVWDRVGELFAQSRARLD